MQTLVLEDVVKSVRRLDPDGTGFNLNQHDLKFVAPVIGCEPHEVMYWLFLAGYRITGITATAYMQYLPTEVPQMVSYDALEQLVSKFQTSGIVFTIASGISVPSEPVLQNMLLRLAAEKGCTFATIPELRAIIAAVGYMVFAADRDSESWAKRR